jgi:hypothetical protein
MDPSIMGASAATPAPPQPWLFIVVLIVLAIAISSVIAYLGLTGQLGAGIVGAKSPSGGISLVPPVGLAYGLSAWVTRNRRT